MSYSLENRLVIGVASSAMFDLSESDAAWRSNRDGLNDLKKAFNELSLPAPLHGVTLKRARLRSSRERLRNPGLAGARANPLLGLPLVQHIQA